MIEMIITLSILGVILYFIDGVLADTIGLPEGAGCSITLIVIFIIVVIMVI